MPLGSDNRICAFDPARVREGVWGQRRRADASAEGRFNVVKAYSIYDEEVGYTQGLQFIVGPLLLNVRSSCSGAPAPHRR